MTRFDVPAPTLNKLILTGGQGSIQIIPYALWVIGANGRLDVFVNDEASILVDASEPGSSTPDWQLFDSQNRRKGAPFDQHLIEALIERIA